MAETVAVAVAASLGLCQLMKRYHSKREVGENMTGFRF